MSTALFLSIELSQLETSTVYRNLDGRVMDIVSNQYETNELEIWCNGELVRHELDIEETELYITHDGKWKMNTCLYIEDEIDDIEEFVSGLTINDFMVYSHMEDKMIDVGVKGHRLI